MTKPERPTVRVFVEEDLAEGQALVLAAGPSHYLRNVMRKAEGSVIGLFNGQSPEFAAKLVKVAKKGVQVELGSVVVPFEPEPSLTLMFSPIKRNPMETLIVKATELGVTRFQPLIMEHTQSERMKVDRLKTIAIEAAEQCERLTVPTFAEPQPLRDVVAEVQGSIGAAFETSDFEPVQAVLARVECLEGLMVGPEGGFSAAEIDWLKQQPGVVGLGLGPRILKTETAGMVLVAIYQALKGDWDKRPDFRGPEKPEGKVSFA